MEINNITGVSKLSKDLNVSRPVLNDGSKLNFSNFLKEGLDKVNDLQLESDEMKRKMILGEVDNLHDVSILSEKANIALQVTMSIRTKILEAYKDIIRLQI